MSLLIEIDPHGVKRQPFSVVLERRELLGGPFTESDLCRLPYDDIVQAALPAAGDHACSLDEVLDHKRRRRERFVHLDPVAFPGCFQYMLNEGMLPDVVIERELRDAPKWADLSARAKLWFKLNCLYTHVDNPEERMSVVLVLITLCETLGYLSKINASRFRNAIVKLLEKPRTPQQMRTVFGRLQEEMLGFLDDEDKEHAHREIVSDFGCTASCYQPITIHS